MKLSIIIPLLNESDVITELYKRLTTALQKDFPTFTYEIIFVDDGSTDDTFEKIKKLHGKDKNITGIQLSRNFGQHVAIAAGIQVANSDYAVLMDADLQDRPESIKRLYKELKKGYDIVYAVRENQPNHFLKRLTSQYFWSFIKFASGLQIVKNQAMLRIFNKKVLLSLKQFKESSLFYAGIFAWIGFHQATVEVQYDPRFKGKSKYSYHKMLEMTLIATLGFSNLPLYYISYFGVIISLFSFILGVTFIIRKVFFDLGVIGWSSLFILLAFLGGLIIFSIGILGLYISKIFQESLKRPLYLIKETV